MIISNHGHSFFQLFKYPHFLVLFYTVLYNLFPMNVHQKTNQNWIEQIFSGFSQLKSGSFFHAYIWTIIVLVLFNFNLINLAFYFIFS